MLSPEQEVPLTPEQIKALTEKTDANVEKKYDRQIRLWGMHGQTALGKSHICLLGCGPSGTETLKNLILPGIGTFSVIDGEEVTHRDLGNNFFVEYSGLGKSRAEETARLLHELNVFVSRGNTINADPAAYISKNPDFVRDYDVLIANNLSDAAVAKLGEACVKWNKICLSIRSNGMVGVIKIFSPEHRILETKRDNQKWDFRIASAWPELQAYCDSYNMDELRANSGEYTHVPFPVLLVKCLAAYKQQHPNQPITGDKQKDAFKEIISKLGGEHALAANFQEAKDNAHEAYKPYEIPQETQDALNDPRADKITPETPRFWVLVAALKAFVKQSGGFLPLVGQLPDISTKASSYVALQKLYRAKHQADVATFKSLLEGLLKPIGKPVSDFEEDYIASFCKHASCLRVINFKGVHEEFDSKKVNLGDLGTACAIGDSKGFWYLAFRAAGRFQNQVGRLPGDRHDDGQSDFETLKKHSDELIAELELEPGTLEDKYLKEMCRFGASQIHTICTYLGGVAAQEVIKLVTKQWEPVNNTFVYDGITGASGAFDI